MNNEELNPSKAYVVLSWLLAVSFRTVKNLCLSAESCQALAQNPAALFQYLQQKRLGKINPKPFLICPKLLLGTVNNALSGEYVKTNNELRTTNEEQFRKVLLGISIVPTFFVLRLVPCRVSSFIKLRITSYWEHRSFSSEAAGLLLSLPTPLVTEASRIRV